MTLDWSLWRPDDEEAYIRRYTERDVRGVALLWRVLIQTETLLIVSDPNRTHNTIVIMWKDPA